MAALEPIYRLAVSVSDSSVAAGHRLTATPLGPGREFDIVRRIAERLGDSGGGLGDDTARVPLGIGDLLVSTDVAVEGVHFRHQWLSDEEVGWRATAAALSDLAATAATPSGVFVALTVAQGSPPERATEIMAGCADAAGAAGVMILGGDLSAGPSTSITVTVLGHAVNPVWRNGARPGDRLWLTGELGGPRAALVAWQDGRTPSPGAKASFAHPRPRLGAADWLSRHGATAMIDLSDGLAGDAQHLAAASAVGLEIALERLSIHPGVHREAARLGQSAAVFAAMGGEDYELLFTMPSEFDGAFDLESATGTGATAIGMVTEAEGVLITLGGVEQELRGFSHQI